MDRWLNVRAKRLCRVLSVLLVIWAPLAWSGSGSLSVAGSSLSSRLAMFEGFGREKALLPAEKAFEVSVAVKDRQTLLATFRPAAGYYLYKERISFQIQGAPGTEIVHVKMPPGKPKTDAFFGTSEVYYQPFQAELLLNRQDADLEKQSLVVGYQGCSESGICYPPISKTVALSDAPAAGGAGGNVSETGRIGQLLGSGNYWLIAVSFLGFGVLLAFTPCMLPMIPILSGVIVRQGERISRGRSFVLSLAYVLGMAITYALAGVAAGLSGTLLSASLQTPWVLGSFALLFVVLALSMFGLYDLQMPAALQSRLSQSGNRLQGGKIGSVFGMGALSAIIVGPCVAAPLAGALLYISQTQDVWLGGSALFLLALGMGIPLLALATSAGSLLPKAGPWMQGIKIFFGALLLATAVWIVSPVLPVAVTLWLWAAWLILCALLLWRKSGEGRKRGWRMLRQGTAVLLLLSGVGLLASVATGGRDILRPFAHLTHSKEDVAAGTLQFEYVSSVADLDRRLSQAQGQYVMLDFYADWCVSCKEMDAFVFTDARVQRKLRDVVLLKADVTKGTPEDLALLKRFGLFGPPGTLFFDKEGQLLQGREVIGYLRADKFLAHLGTVFPE